MRLCVVEDVRTALGWSDIDDVNDPIVLACHNATSAIAGDIRTSFARQTVTDTFYSQTSTWTAPRGPKKLLLKNGFLTAAPVVTAGDRFADATSSTGDTSSVAADLTLGVVAIFDSIITASYIKVAYTCGFTASVGDATLYDQTQVPDWLKQAAAWKAVVLLDANPLFRAKDRPPLDAKYAHRAYMSLIGPNIRYVPEAQPPVL